MSASHENPLENRPIIGPDVMQSGFGVNFLFWSGEFKKIAGEFLSEF